MSHTSSLITPPAGFQQYHSDVTLNFTLNRMANSLAAAELRAFAREVDGIDSFVDAAFAAGEAAAERGEDAAAASYFRGAEFFMAPDDPRKMVAYDQFLSAFGRSRPEVAALRKTVRYGGGELAAKAA